MQMLVTKEHSISVSVSTNTLSRSYLDLVRLCVDVSQLLVHRHGLTELQRPLKHFLQALLCAVHVLQVQQGHPHIQLLLLFPGEKKQDKFKTKYNRLWLQCVFIYQQRYM